MESVLITGASSGFGRDVALALANAGRWVFASMRDISKGAALLEEAAHNPNGRITLIELDVTDAASIGRGVDAVLDAAGGTLDALLANAGIGVMGPFEELSDEICRRQMETNFFGTLAVARAVIPAMRRAGRGRIVVMSSNSVNSPSPFMSMYAASKWALEGWAEALAMEVAPFGVDVPRRAAGHASDSFRLECPAGDARRKRVLTADRGGRTCHC